MRIATSVPVVSVMSSSGSDALVGHTGFVGRNLVAQRHPAQLFHRANLGELRHATADRLWVCGAPAEKWRANQDPADDLAGVELLLGALRHVQANEVVVISTVDVYPQPHGVDEDTHISLDDHPPGYGRNRLHLEQVVRDRFADAVILRLPGLFGPGLKKNLVFDLLHGRGDSFVHRESVFQWYDVRRLADDADRAVSAREPVINLATQPVRAADLARDVFATDLTGTSVPVANYDVHTRAAHVFESDGHYMLNQAAVLADLHDWVASERALA